jgi:hypothetical protein
LFPLITVSPWTAFTGGRTETLPVCDAPGSALRHFSSSLLTWCEGQGAARDGCQSDSLPFGGEFKKRVMLNPPGAGCNDLEARWRGGRISDLKFQISETEKRGDSSY